VKFMLLMNAPRDAFDQYMSWPQETVQAHTDFMHRFGQKLAEAGELAGAEGLALAADAKLVRAGKNGRPLTDGVFPESKEFLAGYWIVDVSSPERAYELAAELSAAPGPGGTPLNTPIEVRAVMSAPPRELG
jgi:hypothetical protein